MPENQKSEQMQRREEELKLLREGGTNPYPYEYDKTHSAKEILDNFKDEDEEQFTDIGVAGRIMSIRKMGKATFCHIQDETGRIQVYFKKNELPEFYDKLKLLDIGDIIGVKGYAFRTRMGEITVHSKDVEVLCKSLKPIPTPKEETDEEGNKKVHDALTDKETRYRKRFLDLIVNPEVKDIFRKRAKAISGIRNYFDSRGWLEVETPVLQPIYGGANARPFVTHHNALDVDLFLRIADELYLKRLIVGGFEGVYEINKNFRNEGMDKNHNPEFTALEVYVAYKDYNWMMDMTENLIKTVTKEVLGELKIDVEGTKIDLEPAFKRIPMFDLYREYTGKDLRGMNSEELMKIAKEHNLELEDNASKMKILDEIFSELVEPNLIQPTFVIDYPVEMSPLAKMHRSEEGIVERFELFINGGEIANAFTELNDPQDQRRRLEEQANIRAAGDDEAMVVDEDFLDAIETGMPPTAGLGIGVDRFIMLLTGKKSIREVILFPQMKPEYHKSKPVDEEDTTTLKELKDQ